MLLISEQGLPGNVKIIIKNPVFNIEKLELHKSSKAITTIKGGGHPTRMHIGDTTYRRRYRDSRYIRDPTLNARRQPNNDETESEHSTSMEDPEVITADSNLATEDVDVITEESLSLNMEKTHI